MKKVDVLVIGAGIAGLTAATRLAQAGKTVLVLEKARGSGGRLSSKRLQTDDQFLSFDLGCPLIQTSTPTFHQQMLDWCQAGCAASLPAAENVFVGMPRNSSITRYLADQLTVQFATRVSRLVHRAGKWHAYIEAPNQEGLQQADAQGDTLLVEANRVVISAPPQQAHDLLPQGHRLRPVLAEYSMHPQWLLLAEIESVRCPSFRAEGHPVIKTISWESEKRFQKDAAQRENKRYCLQIQATEQWSAETIDAERDEVAKFLVQALREVSTEAFEITAQHLHRWLYSLPTQHGVCPEKGFLESDDGVAICGDYLAGNQSAFGVEAAYLSASALADDVAQEDINATEMIRSDQAGV